MKIEYYNVGSMKYAKLDLPLGNLIQIRGETNNGKSLLFYSLEDGLMNNPIFKKWLNNSAILEDVKAEETIVLTDDNGDVYKVIAGLDHLYYYHNNVKYEKTRRNTIFDIIEKQIPGLLYCPDEINPILNIVGENSGLFPIDRSDSQIFKTYERLLSLSCTQDILRAIKLDSEDLELKKKEKCELIQSNTLKSTQIRNTLNKVNEDELFNIKTKLQAYLNINNKFICLYNSTLKDSQYIHKFNLLDIENIPDFDMSKFSNQLTDLVKAKKYLEYITSFSRLNISFQSDFDTQKFKNLIEIVDKSNKIINEIQLFKDEIDKDEKDLQDIQYILSQLKICPLCGAPLGECNETIHSK